MNINRLIAQSISNTTSSMRFNGCFNANINDFQNNLIPFERIKFMINGYAPILPSTKSYSDQPSVNYITNNCFDAEFMFTQCNPIKGVYMSSCLMFRGDVVPKEINVAVAALKTKKTISLIDWRGY